MGKVNAWREEEWEAKCEAFMNHEITEKELCEYGRTHGRDEYEISGVIEEYDRQNEAAYGRFVERFFGGSGPQTARERYLVAWKQKQELKR